MCLTVCAGGGATGELENRNSGLAGDLEVALGRIESLEANIARTEGLCDSIAARELALQVCAREDTHTGSWHTCVLTCGPRSALVV